MKDLYNDLLPVISILPQVAKTDVDGTGVDLAGYEGALMIAHVGQSGDTLSGSVSHTLIFQESDISSSGYTAIADTDLLGGANSVVIDAAAEDEVIVRRGYLGNKRYVRVIDDLTGTHTNGTPISAMVIKGRPRHAPAA